MLNLERHSRYICRHSQSLRIRCSLCSLRSRHSRHSRHSCRSCHNRHMVWSGHPEGIYARIHQNAILWIKG